MNEDKLFRWNATLIGSVFEIRVDIIVSFSKLDFQWDRLKEKNHGNIRIFKMLFQKRLLKFWKKEEEIDRMLIPKIEYVCLQQKFFCSALHIKSTFISKNKLNRLVD